MNNNTNVDPQEVAKFEQLAATWWDPEGHSGPLHAMNPVRVSFIERHCGGLFDKKVADVGCGGGLVSEAIAKCGAQVTGLDMGEEPLEVARLHALETGIEVDYLNSTAEQHADGFQGKYDVVCCLEMLEHVPDPQSVINACIKMLRPGGHLFMSTINKTPEAYLTTIVGAEHLVKALPKGTHDFNKFLRPSQLSRWCEQQGMLMQHASGLFYNPLTKTVSLNKSLRVNYILHAQKPQS
ncbi:bifunctional 2-polyprenyl-6-hydroxyphenol methylase/3-demethylubiquinol 3-O-methyltransferase UbiG [Ferrimonas lipolytica]|uniref:Ubiquinone biosynthesis O-methyltransferase n=1 Tax=Ferrimonas lipolytica TaxID=2724191 RepID=A0A6H1UEH8_9GAMM|nr:bifunctional 2-polyprenyl-6-hydroxyphenol methylase/3-demethylubiquinol 3-O-methyltransferase UbiG [Ferrimonas lipolytica]QIZ76616.1 bifunctional 2-polyprenyl-6-hydroxyphenol methylase/3-demethylubiquinol 3-O-methyltransferase UbiG [Ferrimonas lipolytica]